jgi:hypothetical protein
MRFSRKLISFKGSGSKSGKKKVKERLGVFE